jgi:N-acetylglucosamine kinase-like BadF-type ATPase
MAGLKLIADSGATKTEWCLAGEGKNKKIITQGISPYFLNSEQIQELLQKELRSKIKNEPINEVHYYGTGCANPNNVKMIQNSILKVFPKSKVNVTHDLMAAARALCGNKKGIACILGTGSNSCLYDGKKIVKNSPGLGYVLGDEGSGAYLGKKVLQHYLYAEFDSGLMARFDATYVTTAVEILENVYKKPMPSRYLSGFAKFLADNRGHETIEKIIEEGLNDFFVAHICRYNEAAVLPINFTGGVAFGFQDVLLHLCQRHELKLGKILKSPMEGLIEYHS